MTTRTLYNEKDAFAVKHDTENKQSMTQSVEKHRQKSSDLRRRLKTDSDVEEVTLDGRLFHTREAATGNERSPLVGWRIGVTSVDVDADRSRDFYMEHNQSTFLLLFTRVMCQHVFKAIFGNFTTVACAIY